MTKTAKRSGEFDLIAKFFAPLSRGEAGAFSLTDDAAALTPREGCDLVVTTDAIVAGVHFFAGDPPDAIAQKALRVNVSDLAAKGARPWVYLLTAVLPRDVDDAWVKAFAGGLKRDQERFGLTLVGGDTTATPGPLTVSIVALGEVGRGIMLTRGGAKSGDDVWVTGTIGDAFLGLKVLQGKMDELSAAQQRAVVGRYRLPDPRVTVGQGLVGLAHACVDVSDGLAADLGHVAKVSGVAVRIQGHEVPLSAAAKAALRSGGVQLADLVSGGDDYELAFAAPPSVRSRIEALAGATRVPITRIGEVTAGKGVTLLSADGAPMPLARAGFTHF
jgi:thiamine-monophosphate kinase